MKIGAIIVSQNTCEFPNAVAAIREEADELVAIENLSSSPVAVFAGPHTDPSFHFVVNEAPLSFAQNINKGWRMLEGCDAILIANSDIEVPEGWRALLELALRDEPELGAASLLTDLPLRKPGISKCLGLVFTLVRVAAVTWADVPMDEDFVNYGTDISLAFQLDKHGWLHRWVDGLRVEHHMSSGDKRSFKSGEQCPRDSGVFARKYGDPHEYNTP